MQKDKALHMLLGFAIVVIFFYLFGFLVAATACFVAAIGKEVYDKVSGKGTPDFLDIVATVVGGGVGIGACFLFIGQQGENFSGSMTYHSERCGVKIESGG